MKTKKLSKKMSLNKVTVTNLEATSMMAARGGVIVHYTEYILYCQDFTEGPALCQPTQPPQCIIAHTRDIACSYPECIDPDTIAYTVDCTEPLE